MTRREHIILFLKQIIAMRDALNKNGEHWLDGAANEAEDTIKRVEGMTDEETEMPSGEELCLR